MRKIINLIFALALVTSNQNFIAGAIQGRTQIDFSANGRSNGGSNTYGSVIFSIPTNISLDANNRSRSVPVGIEVNGPAPVTSFRVQTQVFVPGDDTQINCSLKPKYGSTQSTQAFQQTASCLVPRRIVRDVFTVDITVPNAETDVIADLYYNFSNLGIAAVENNSSDSGLLYHSDSGINSVMLSCGEAKAYSSVDEFLASPSDQPDGDFNGYIVSKDEYGWNWTKHGDALASMLDLQQLRNSIVHKNITDVRVKSGEDLSRQYNTPIVNGKFDPSRVTYIALLFDGPELYFWEIATGELKTTSEMRDSASSAGNYACATSFRAGKTT